MEHQEQTLRLTKPIVIEDTDPATGKGRVLKLSELSSEVASWKVVPPGLLQVQWWGGREAKADGVKRIHAGEEVEVQAYLLPLSSIQQMDMGTQKLQKNPAHSGIVIPGVNAPPVPPKVLS